MARTKNIKQFRYAKPKKLTPRQEVHETTIQPPMPSVAPIVLEVIPVIVGDVMVDKKKPWKKRDLRY